MADKQQYLDEAAGAIAKVLSAEPTGTDRWSFEPMPELEFDRWARAWVKSPRRKTNHSLSVESYGALLTVTLQKSRQNKVNIRRFRGHVSRK